MSVTVPHTKTIFAAVVERAIERYGFAEQSNITVEQLADIVGFNDQEKKFAAMSWSLIYTDEWIYLSDEIILTQLTTETGKDAIHDFVKRELLTAEHIYGRDYVRILKNGDILSEQGTPTTEFDINFHSSNLPNRIYGNRKRYFIVSPDCMKSLLLRASTRRGNETRGYFVKLEKLAAVMREYMIRKDEIRRDRAIEDERRAHHLAVEHERAEVEKAKAELEETKKKAYQTEADMRLRAIRIKEMKFPLEPSVPDGKMYILTTSTYERKNIYKIGRTSASMHQRIAGYETGRTSNDKMRCVYARECFATKETEEYIKEILAPYLEDPSKPRSEMFVMKFEDLRTLFDICIDNSARCYDFLNDYWARKEEIVARLCLQKDDEQISISAPPTTLSSPLSQNNQHAPCTTMTVCSPVVTQTTNIAAPVPSTSSATNSAMFDRLARIQEIVQRNGEILAPDVNIAALVTEIHANPAIMFALRISMATSEYVVVKRAITLFNVDVDMCAGCPKCERKNHVGHLNAHIMQKGKSVAKMAQQPESRDAIPSTSSDSRGDVVREIERDAIMPRVFDSSVCHDAATPLIADSSAPISTIATQLIPAVASGVICAMKKHRRKYKIVANPVVLSRVDNIRKIVLRDGELISPAEDIDAIMSLMRNDQEIMVTLGLTQKSREYVTMKRLIKILGLENEITCAESPKSQTEKHRRVRLMRHC